MNYLKIKIAFWQLRRSKRITSLQADLYDFLLQESMGRGWGMEWENPFECSNKLICAGIGISEDAIIDARNRLKQLGLIDFLPGLKNKRSPVYELLYPFKTGNTAGNMAGNYTGNEAGKAAGNNPNLYKEKHNQTETEHSSSSEEEDANSQSENGFGNFSGRQNPENPQSPGSAPPLSPRRPPRPPGSNAFRRPSLEEVEDYFREKRPEWPSEQVTDEAETFCDHYTSNGWKVGKNPMKDWQAAIRTWLKKDYNNGNNSQTAQAGQSGTGGGHHKRGAASTPRSEGATINDLQARKL